MIVNSPNVPVNYQNNIYYGLKRFIDEELPKNKNISVIQGQQNLTSLPAPPLVVMQYLYDNSYQTNEHTYTKDKLIISHHSNFSVQLDFYGSDEIDALTMCKIIETKFRDDYAIDWFRKNNFAFLPLYCEAPHNAAFIDQSSQYADRWTMIIKIDHAPQVCVEQDFAKSLEVTPYPLPRKGSN